MTAPKPAFGLAWQVPDTALAAWGTRMIVQQDGYVDFVPDRQGADGPQEHKDRLFELLEERIPVAELKALIGDLLRRGLIQTRVDEDFVLHMDHELVVVANTRASAGYCYVTTWLLQDAEARDLGKDRDAGFLLERVGVSGEPIGPFDDEISASLYMDEHELSDNDWKIVPGR